MTKICFISDTHYSKYIDNTYLKIAKDTDILIHCGDFSMRASQMDLDIFIAQFAKLPGKEKIFIAGNHDIICERLGKEAVKQQALEKGVLYLEDDSYISSTGLNIYGSPYSPLFGRDWAYQLLPGQMTIDKWKQIPYNIDLLVTHGPPYGIGDEVCNYSTNYKVNNVGCHILTSEIFKRDSIRVHAAGHIHEMSGIRQEHNKAFVNASMLDDNYKLKYPPRYITLDERKPE